ncbi:MAG: tryptophan synthase subunit alpha, partial [Candidatus Methylomirabilales bacterium]
MNKIDACFQGLRARKEPALIPFVTGGDPDLETTVRLAEAFAEQGADLLEIGVPFSEPLADGTTIQRASERALKAGVTLGAILRMVEQLRERSGIPVVLMSYYNPIFCMGVDAFTRRAAAASVDGVIVPDLP